MKCIQQSTTVSKEQGRTHKVLSARVGTEIPSNNLAVLVPRYELKLQEELDNVMWVLSIEQARS